MVPKFESKYFSLEQVTFSDTAKRLGIVNACLPEHYDNAAWLLNKIVEPLRDKKEFIISSWYRSAALNTAIKGSRTSDHMLGFAVDILPVRMALKDFYDYIKNETQLPYKQLILEFNSWVHISYERTDKPRRQNLTAIRGLNGETQYLNG